MKRYTPQQIIAISREIPISEFEQAEMIAKEFQDQKLVYIPRGSLFMDFWRMIAAIWYGGYISGVQAERNRKRITAPETKSL